MFREHFFMVNVRGALLQPSENVLQRFPKGFYITNFKSMFGECFINQHVQYKPS